MCAAILSPDLILVATDFYVFLLLCHTAMGKNSSIAALIIHLLHLCCEDGMCVIPYRVLISGLRHANSKILQVTAHRVICSSTAEVSSWKTDPPARAQQC